MKQHKIIWKGLVHTSAEFASVIEDKLTTVEGHITGVDEEIPFYVNYKLLIDADWNVKAVSIKAETHSQLSFEFEKDPSGSWRDLKENLYPNLDGCIDIDISLTPFTNTLPIRRLKLKEDESKEIKVLYFDFPGGKFRTERQRYRNVGNMVYSFESLDTGFKTNIEVDDDGLVVEYPELWTRTYP